MRARRHPFDQSFVECEVSGLSIREIIGNDSDAYAVTLNGEIIEAERWGAVIPADGVLNVTPIPQDDSGVLQLIATIALVAVSGPIGTYLGKALWGSAAFWSGVTIAVGQLLISALIPPPTPRLQAEEARRGLLAISGTRNRFALYEPVPEVAGKHRVYPPYAAQPYTEIVGDDQYFNALFCVGLGDYEITEAKIGETALTSYEGIDLEQTTDPSWVDITEQSLDITLDDPLDPSSPTTTATRTTQTGVEAISVDFICPAGLIYTNSKGERRSVSIDFTVEYRAAGTADPWTAVRPRTVGGFDWIDWTLGRNIIIGTSGAANPSYVGPITGSPLDANDFRVTDKTVNAVRFGVKWEVPEGQYEVRVTRTYLKQSGGNFEDITPADREAELAKYLQIFKWVALRSHNTDTASVNIPSGTATFLKLRIKANDQLTGIIDQLNVVAERKLRTWNKGTQAFTTPATTRNPAWFALNVLTGPGNARAIVSESDRIWLDDFADWAAECTTEGRHYDRIIEARSSVWEELKRAAAVGRAAPVMRDTKHTVVLESDGQAPVGMVTARNIRGFTSTRKFVTIPHALRVRFVSASAGYKEDEIIVYDDGYNAGNATLFEELPLEGVTDSDLAWKMGRYHLAAARLRPEIYSGEMDFEHLTFTRGEQVLVQQDVLLFALGAGRIQSISGASNEVITTDEQFVIDGAKTYAVQVRYIDSGTVAVHNSVATATPGNNVNEFTLSTPNADIAVGDLLLLGESGSETIPLKVLGIEPTNDLGARVTFVDAATAIENADSGTIPAYNPNITVPSEPQKVAPPAPTITEVRSDTNLRTRLPNGSISGRLIISIVVPGYEGLGINELEARIRVKTTGQESPWIILPRVGARSGSISTSEAEVGEIYQVQARTISFFGIPSDWTATVEHQVGDIVLAPPAVDGFTLSERRGEILAVIDLTNVDILDASKLIVRYATTNDAGHASAVDRSIAIPGNLDAIDELQVGIPFSDTTTRYFWMRLVDIYGNIGGRYPAGTNAGIEATPLAPAKDASEIIFRQSTAPTHEAGRVWIDTDNNIVYRSNGTVWEQIGSLDDYYSAEDAGTILRELDAPGTLVNYDVLQIAGIDVTNGSTVLVFANFRLDVVGSGHTIVAGCTAGTYFSSSDFGLNRTEKTDNLADNYSLAASFSQSADDNIQCGLAVEIQGNGSNNVDARFYDVEVTVIVVKR